LSAQGINRPAVERRPHQRELTVRVFDLVLCAALLPAALLIGAITALLIYVDSPGSVFYRSTRVGRYGRTFEMLKFRKMRREAGSQPITLEEDERFTPIGRFLAATRLDELPQVWNVLRGEMRLVGPRPELECFVAEFAEEYAQILSVVPGITGPSQIRFVDERHLLTGEDPETTYRTHVLPLKIKLDLEYARSHPLIGDLGIILSTVVLPVRLLLARLRSGRMRLALWIPAAAAAVALALVFLLTSSHLS
jgi:lipopolysaccharide/colanic/teichoic acid biosynthesis glycosyltransferase